MKRRLLAVLLTIALMLTLMTPVLASIGDVSRGVTVDAEKAVVSITGEKTTLTAITDEDDAEFRWQFLADEDINLWVSIYGEDAGTCDLTYAKVCNMLNEDGEAQVRCVARLSDGTYYSDPVTVTIDETIPDEVPQLDLVVDDEETEDAKLQEEDTTLEAALTFMSDGPEGDPSDEASDDASGETSDDASSEDSDETSGETSL